MYLASKYEDIFPLHSRVVSDKIAHKAISAPAILKKEVEFLGLFDYEMNFVTHYDLHETYCERLFMSRAATKKLNKLISDMSLLLTKMAI